MEPITDCCNFGKELSKKETLLYESENFFVCSAVGQMGIEGYVHICTKKHISCYGMVPKNFDKEFFKIKQKVSQVLGDHYGISPVFFENGPSKKNPSRKNQRIAHVHIHAIPIDVDTDVLFGDIGEWIVFYDYSRIRDLVEVQSSYFWLENRDGIKKYIPIPLNFRPGILREKISKYRGVQSSDWRTDQDMETYRKTIITLKSKFALA